MQINNVMGTTVGPAAYFLNFSYFGIQCVHPRAAPIFARAMLSPLRRYPPTPPPNTAFPCRVNKGHEVMLDRAWLGETNFDFPFSQASPPKAVAIQLNGNDHCEKARAARKQAPPSAAGVARGLSPSHPPSPQTSSTPLSFPQKLDWR